jgi:hypothetical protein
MLQANIIYQLTHGMWISCLWTFDNTLLVLLYDCGTIVLANIIYQFKRQGIIITYQKPVTDLKRLQ